MPCQLLRTSLVILLAGGCLWLMRRSDFVACDSPILRSQDVVMSVMVVGSGSRKEVMSRLFLAFARRAVMFFILAISLSRCEEIEHYKVPLSPRAIAERKAIN